MINIIKFILLLIVIGFVVSSLLSLLLLIVIISSFNKLFTVTFVCIDRNSETRTRCSSGSTAWCSCAALHDECLASPIYVLGFATKA
jgi:hypothetical protein